MCGPSCPSQFALSECMTQWQGAQDLITTTLNGMLHGWRTVVLLLQTVTSVVLSNTLAAADPACCCITSLFSLQGLDPQGALCQQLCWAQLDPPG
jgi:hypothetical protein